MGQERDNNLSSSHLIYMASRCRSSMPVMVNNNAQYYSPETASSMALLSANLLVPNALSPLGTVLSRTTLSRSLFLTDLFRSFSHKGLVTLSNRSFLGPKPDWFTYFQFGAAQTENTGLTYFNLQFGADVIEIQHNHLRSSNQLFQILIVLDLQ